MWVAIRSKKYRSWLMTTASREGQERLFEVAEGLHIEVVRGLVEEHQVAAGLEQLGEMHAVALSTGEGADLLLLVRSSEVEGRDVGARVHLVAIDVDDVVSTRDLFPDRLGGVQGVARLVHVGQVDRLANAEIAESGCSSPVIILKSVVLPAPFAPMMPTMPPRGG